MMKAEKDDEEDERRVKTKYRVEELEKYQVSTTKREKSEKGERKEGRKT